MKTIVDKSTNKKSFIPEVLMKGALLHSWLSLLLLVTMVPILKGKIEGFLFK